MNKNSKLNSVKDSSANFLIKGSKFIAAETLIVCTFFAQIFSVFAILFVQGLIPAFRRIFLINEKIMYILPVLAVLWLSLLFVKINNRFFQMRLRDVIRNFFIVAVLCVILFVILGMLVSFLASFIPEDTLMTIKNVSGMPFAILMILGGPSFFLLLISLIGLCFLCIMIFPLILFTGFSIVSFYEKFPRIVKIIFSSLIKLFLLAYFITVIVFGFRRTTDDLFEIEYSDSCNDSIIYTIKQIHRQNDYDFKEDKFGFFFHMVKKNYPMKCLQLFMDYGYDLNEHKSYIDAVSTHEQMEFFLNHGVDANKFIIDAVKYNQFNYKTIAMLVDAGADVNLKEKFSDVDGDYSVIQWYLAHLDLRIRLESIDNIIGTLQLLIDKGADLNYRSAGKHTALGVLLVNYGLDMDLTEDKCVLINYLMDNGADPKKCLPENLTVENMYYWHALSKEVLDRLAEGGMKKGRWPNVGPLPYYSKLWS